MKKALIIFFVVASLVFPALAIGGEDPEPLNEKGERATHTVLGEYGTATWCGYCKYAHGALKSLYAGGTLDFNYVSFVSDVNTYAATRLSAYNLYGYPTVFWDGGYKVDVGAGSQSGAEATYTASITSAGNRAVYNIGMSLTVQWLGNAAMNISVAVTNNEATTYNGYLKVYVTEISSSLGWIDTAGYPYTHAFLQYAFNENLAISPGGTFHDYIVWDGHNYQNGYGTYYGSIQQNNIMVIGAVYNSTWHQGYAYPPSGNPFAAYYVDEVASAIPTTDATPPTITNVQATPPSQIPGGTVNITATVTDNTAVDAVQATITPPSGPVLYCPMIKQASTSTYYYQSTYTTLGTYSFYIWAKDSSNNQATSPTYTFVIKESTPPVIQDITVAKVGGDVLNVSCLVTDNVEVDGVKLYLTNPSGGETTVYMGNILGTDRYYYTTSYPLLGDYNFYIWANDTSGNNVVSGDWVIMRGQMYQGWNLITVPVDNSWTAETLGQNISGCVTISMFNVTTDTFVTHVVGTPWDNFPIMDGVGYYCYLTTGSVFTSSGPSIGAVSVAIDAGWNIIGWFREDTATAESVGDSISGCLTLSMFNAQTQMFLTHVVNTPADNFPVERGMGLFIYTTASSVWHGEG